MKTTIPLFSIALAFLSVSVLPQASATCQEGCLTNQNTALGEDALINNSGSYNTAVGFDALFSNTSGEFNTALGYTALLSNTTGNPNTAVGNAAMYNNTTSFGNTAIGSGALFANTTGEFNTAIGIQALELNTTGTKNTAIGELALWNNIGGSNNVALGDFALAANASGNNNIAIGHNAGGHLATGSNNIHIGNAGPGAGESGTIRIGTLARQTSAYIAGISGVTVPGGVGVIIDTNGQLGTVVSSERFKDEVRPMNRASEAIFALKPVTFRYKHELDPDSIPQFGLVAEDVEKVNPDLVARDDEGKPYTVRYEAVNAMLLNEFLKEHRKNEEQRATIARLEKQVDALTAGLQKVTAQLELSKPATQTVNNP
jgi:Chaperone of endosialidase